MMRWSLLSFVLISGLADMSAAQSAAAPTTFKPISHTVYLECGSLWDGKAEKAIPQVRVAVAMPEGKIVRVQPRRKNVE